MTCFEHLVDENLSILSHEKDIYTRVLKESPEGSLAYENYRGEIRYLHFLPQGKDASGKCKYQRRRITRNPGLLNALATK